MTRQRTTKGDYVLICKPLTPTDDSREYRRTFHGCADMTEATAMANCEILEKQQEIQEVTDNWNFSVVVRKKQDTYAHYC